MFIIQRKIDKMFLYGKKHFTPSFAAARRFHSPGDAKAHLEQWFDPTDYKVIGTERDT